MAVEEKEDFKGRRKREVKNVAEPHDKTSDIWISPIPPFVTVDELSIYRKKPHLGCLLDNIKIEEGSFKQLKTEYQRRFKNFYEVLKFSFNGTRKDGLGIKEIKSDPSLKLVETQDYQSEYDQSFNRHILQRSNATSERIMNEVYDNEVSNRLPPITAAHRRHLYKRSTNLKIEGDFSHLTEYADKFIEYLLAKRAELCRTPTTLKLGTGEMESKTETTDQFKHYDIMERPTLCRKFNNLHLEGGLENKTEKQEKFIPFELQSRPPLTKKLTNLHLEGDHSLIPEYRHQYVKYQNPERTEPILPLHNLKSARLFEDITSEVNPIGRRISNFGRTSPLIPFLRESYSHYDLEQDKKVKRSNSSSRYQSNVSLNRTSSHPNLTKSAISGDSTVTHSPQKNAYLDFDRSRNLSLERKRTRGYGTGHEIPEYKSAYTEFPRERPRVRRPESNFTNEGEVEYLSEKRDKYRDHRPQEKAKPYRRRSAHIFDDPFEKHIEIDPAFEGPFECQPEYRKAYKDYLIREKPPPGQRRRILEIPDININDKLVSDIDTSSPNDKTEKTISTSDRPKSSLGKPSSSSSSVPSSPKTTSDPKKLSPKKDTTQRKPSDRRQRVFQRSVIPSPVPLEKPSRSPSPKLEGNWRRHKFKESAVLNTDKPNAWNSLEADPPFFILNDRVPSRRSIRNDLYKEQKWMPSWYSGSQ